MTCLSVSHIAMHCISITFFDAKASGNCLHETLTIKVHNTLTFFICQSVDFTSQKLNSWQKNWVQLSCQVDIVMLIRVGQLDDLLLESEQVLDISSLVVFLEQLGLIVVASHVVTALRFIFLQIGKILETVS